MKRFRCVLVMEDFNKAQQSTGASEPQSTPANNMKRTPWFDPRFVNLDPRFVNLDPRFVNLDPRFVNL